MTPVPGTAQPTIVLVHGAFAESASWNGVVQRLHAHGYPVIAAGNPLRSLSGDAAAVSAVLATVTGPVVLVGHSYGGAVASNAAVGHARHPGLGAGGGGSRDHRRGEDDQLTSAPDGGRAQAAV
jgi:pimeloyl-ACP methyl ester carboxylesterase